MRTLAIAAGNSTSPSEQTCTGSGTVGHLLVSAMRVARTLWPRKTAHELAVRQGVSLRTAKYQLAEARDLSGEQLARLLRSEEGLQFLVAAMGEARPKWWRVLVGHLKFIDAERLARAAERQYREATNARDLLNATRGVAAQLAHDPQFHEPYVAALRSMAGADGAPHHTGTASKGRVR